MIDEAGLIRDFSKTAERLFGWKPEETFGRNVSMLMPAPYREEHDSYLHRYYDTGERRTFPNMMSREGARGQEYNAWSGAGAPTVRKSCTFRMATLSRSGAIA